MAIRYDFYKRHEKWVKQVALLWLKTLDVNPKIHQKAERLLHKWGFTAWNLVSIAEGYIDYE